MTTKPISGNHGRDPDRGTVKRILKTGGAIVAFLVVIGGIIQITGIVSPLFDDAPKKAFATSVGADGVVRTTRDSELVTDRLARIAQRTGEARILQGKFAELKIQADRSLVPSSDDRPSTVPGGREVPPHIDLPTVRCPQAPGVPAVMRVYLYGDNIGADNVGYRNSNFAVEGLFTLSEVKDPGPESRPVFCWIDATEVDPE